ncbi:MAG: hypothetical protein Q7R66_05775 [Undibacterium sp.]|uniref:hypothetical protein n=1 Tax=Undibacterium sp. TaxID=1914977 RepID=UPI0027273FD1|nr:hypothetical protein [Undibacterium sp.]MDO8651679.1 hypothetical protein [Undibacterium sp.]
MQYSPQQFKHNKQVEKQQQTEALDDVVPDLAKKIGIPVDEVRKGLLGMGFNETLYRKETVFAIALLCEGRFKYLAEHYPNLKDVIDSLLFGAELGRMNDDSSRYRFLYRDVYKDRELKKNNFVNWVSEIAGYFSIIQKGKIFFQHSESELDHIALIWLQSAVLQAYPDALPSLRASLQGLSHSAPFSIFLMEEFCRSADQSKSVFTTGFAKVGLEVWLTEHAKLFELDSLKPWNNKWHPAIDSSLTELKSINSGHANILKDSSQRRFSFPALSERELLKTHWYYPTQKERDQIKKYFKTHLLAGAAHEHEALVLALSIATFRPIEAVLEMTFGNANEVHLQGSDAIVLEWIGAGQSSQLAAIWRKAEHGVIRRSAALSLPTLILDYLKPLVPTTGYIEISQLVNRELRDEVSRCYATMEQVFERRFPDAELILRNYLSRNIYAETANSALVRFFQNHTQRKIDRADRLALNHYLHINGTRASKPYEDACDQIFGQKAMHKGSELQIEQGTKHLHWTEVENAVEHLAKGVETSGEVTNDTSATCIEQHNQFAKYSLFILLALTGHRKSKTPFYFPWDVNLEANAVFIADKMVTGSEARFVPLCNTARGQFKQYIHHLTAVANMDEMPMAVKEHAQMLSEYFSFDRKQLDPCARLQEAPLHSLFFTIRSKGHVIKTIGTNTIDSVILQIEQGQQKSFTGRLRATLAQYLWEKGCSGREVQTFLGHHPEMHAFGPESSMVFDAWVKEMRPVLDSYAALNRLKVLASPFRKIHTREIYASVVIPGLSLPTGQRMTIEEMKRDEVLDESSFVDIFFGDLNINQQHEIANVISGTAAIQQTVQKPMSYEDRHIDSSWAIERVRALVRQELDDIWFSENSVKIKEDDVKVIKAELKKKILEKYPNDLLVQRKLNAQLAEYLQNLNRSSDNKVTAASSNLVKTKPGPIEIGFARALHIATIHNRIWTQQVGSVFVRKNKVKAVNAQTVEDKIHQKPVLDPLDRTERLAQIAISLVSFDAVLVPQRIKELIQAIDMGHGIKLYKHAMSLRANVVSHRFATDFSDIPCGVTTALIARLPYQDVDSVEHSPVPWAEVQKCIKLILLSTLGARERGKSWSLLDLCDMYQAYWHLRLPGVLYAIAIGDFCGPAPTQISEDSLCGDHEKPVLLAKKISTRPIVENKGNRENQQRSAFKAIQKILNQARGRLEDGTKTKKKQRAKLSNYFNNPHDENLDYWINQQQVIDLLFRFVKRLYTHGGSRKPILEFETISKYFSTIAMPLIEETWNKDFEVFTEENYDNLYKQVKLKSVDKRADCTGYLKIFHQCVRDAFNAPFCRQWADVMEPAHCRATLLTASAIDDALMYLKEEQQPSALLIACANGYGLRRTEALGLICTDFEDKGPLSITTIGIRGLKSADSRRHLAATCNSSEAQRMINEARNAAIGSPKKQNYLFESRQSNDDMIESGQLTAQRSIGALRLASGNKDVVLHDLRHTYATRLMLLVLCPEPKLPITVLAMERLLGRSFEDSRNMALNILQAPEKWPFKVDAVARAVGHAGIDTLLNSYFHAAHLAMAEFTYANELIRLSTMNDELFARLLGKGRSTLTKSREKAAIGKADLPEKKQDMLHDFYVQHVKDSNAKKINSRSEHTSHAESSRLESSQDAQSESAQVKDKHPWYLYNRLLITRAHRQCSMQELTDHAMTDLGIEKTAVESFVQNMTSLVGLGFNDFEHCDSELSVHHAKRHDDMHRGSALREAYLKRMHTAIKDGNAFDVDFRQTLKRWRDKLNASQPTLICYSKDEFEQTLRVLAGLGISANKCKYVGYGPMSETFKQETLYRFENREFKDKSYPAGMVKTHSHPSVGIEVMSARKNATPDRNFHLAMMVAYSACM